MGHDINSIMCDRVATKLCYFSSIRLFLLIDFIIHFSTTEIAQHLNIYTDINDNKCTILYIAQYHDSTTKSVMPPKLCICNVM